MVSVIALIVFGPRRLPEIARSIGRAVNEFRRQASDIRAEFESGLSVEDEKQEPTEPNQPYVHKETTAPSGSKDEAEDRTTPSTGFEDDGENEPD